MLPNKIDDNLLTYKKEIIKFCDKHVNPGLAKRDKLSIFDKELWRKCGELGLLGLPVPIKYGGQGLSPIETVYIIQSLGYGSKDAGLNFSICAHLFACIIPILRYGSESQKLKFLPDLCNGKLIATNAITEAASGSDVYSMNSKAVLQDNYYTIDGIKSWCTNGPVSDICIFYAKTSEKGSVLNGFSAFILEKREQHYTHSNNYEKIGIRTSTIGEISCSNSKIPISSRIGKEGKGGLIFSDSMNWEKIFIAACHNGSIKRIMDTVSVYAKKRIVGGKSISSYQAISHKIAEIKIKYEASKLLIYNAAVKLNKEDQTISLDSSIVKVFVSESLFFTASEAIQIFGACGIISDYGIERELRDSVASKIYSGTNEIHKNIIAKWVTGLTNVFDNV